MIFNFMRIRISADIRIFHGYPQFGYPLFSDPDMDHHLTNLTDTDTDLDTLKKLDIRIRKRATQSFKKTQDTFLVNRVNI